MPEIPAASVSLQKRNRFHPAAYRKGETPFPVAARLMISHFDPACLPKGNVVLLSQGAACWPDCSFLPVDASGNDYCFGKAHSPDVNPAIQLVKIHPFTGPHGSKGRRVLPNLLPAKTGMAAKDWSSLITKSDIGGFNR